MCVEPPCEPPRLLLFELDCVILKPHILAVHPCTDSCVIHMPAHSLQPTSMLFAADVLLRLLQHTCLHFKAEARCCSR